MSALSERSSLLIGGALGLAVGAAVTVVVTRRKRKLRKSTCPPTMQAGKLDDLVVAHESWRDVRPYHLEDCTSPISNSREGSKFHDKWVPMQPYGSVLRTLQPTDGLSPDYNMSLIPKSAFGYRPYSDLEGKPFKVYAGFHMTRQARLWRSATVDRVIAAGGTRPVTIASEKGVTFNTIFQMIADMGATAYAYGGVLRDILIKGEHVADDIDVLFTCSVKQLVKACEARGWKEGDESTGLKGDFYLKRDEKTGEKRYEYIAIGEGTEKFSGHTLDSNCAGEFAFNCMLYDVQKKILIDSSGWGVQDAAWNFLRIPYDGGHIAPDGRSQWELWSQNCDRMPGMISLRFFNFRSRGCIASPKTVEHCVRWMMHQEQKEVALTIETFMKRKIMKKGNGVATADKKLAQFKATVLQDFDMALGSGEGAAWWAQTAEPVVQKLRAKLMAEESKA